MNDFALNAPLRVLYLSQDPALIRRQLAGETLTREQAGPLRDDVSTDEITPVHILSHYDDRLGDFAHTGLRCGSDNPIGHKTLRQAGFQVLVAGRRYGKGSSREHSPTAEKLAGVQLVIAESFERIYRQNADNIGLFTSTDFGLLAQIERGEAITLADLVAYNGAKVLHPRTLAPLALPQSTRASGAPDHSPFSLATLPTIPCAPPHSP